MKYRIRYLKRTVSRHGKTVLYVRLPGRKNLIRLPVDQIDHPDFLRYYSAALNGDDFVTELRDAKNKSATLKSTVGSFGELAALYKAFLARDPVLSYRTKYVRGRHLDEVCRQVIMIGVGTKARNESASRRHAAGAIYHAGCPAPLGPQDNHPGGVERPEKDIAGYVQMGLASQSGQVQSNRRHIADQDPLRRLPHVARKRHRRIYLQSSAW